MGNCISEQSSQSAKPAATLRPVRRVQIRTPERQNDPIPNHFDGILPGGPINYSNPSNDQINDSNPPQILETMENIVEIKKSDSPPISQKIETSDEDLYTKLKRFENITISSYRGYSTKGIVTRVIDGDTFEILFFNSDQKPVKLTARLYGVDTYESRPSKKIEENERQRIKKLAKEGKEFTDNFVRDKLLQIVFSEEKEKFGRMLVKVSFENLDLSDELVNHNLAVRYFGGKKTLPS